MARLAQSNGANWPVRHSRPSLSGPNFWRCRQVVLSAEGQFVSVELGVSPVPLPLYRYRPLVPCWAVSKYINYACKASSMCSMHQLCHRVEATSLDLAELWRAGKAVEGKSNRSTTLQTNWSCSTQLGHVTRQIIERPICRQWANDNLQR